MNCLVCGSPLFTWKVREPKSLHDYYCSGLHGPQGTGLFYVEVWDGEKYVLTHSKPDAKEVKSWPAPATPADSASDGATSSSSSAVGFKGTPVKVSRSLPATKRASTPKRARRARTGSRSK